MNFWWRAIRLLARLMVRGYYGSFRVTGAEKVPDGPVLFVVNHPNSLLDAAAVLLAVPRPVSFAAKHTLFRMPVLGIILRRLDAVPIYRPSDAKGMGRRNLEVLHGYIERLKAGGAGVIFPEGVSHPDPELKEVKSGPARIVVGAEQETDFELGLHVVPVGLQFEPRQQFRGDVMVRIGAPFTIGDLKGKHRRQAIRAVQERIRDSLRPLMFHLDRVELEPLVRRVAEIYDEHQRAVPSKDKPRPRPEIVHLAGACLNHYLVVDPEAVEHVRKRVRVYDRLAAHAGISAEILKSKQRPVRAFVRFFWLFFRLLLGFPLFAWGCLTSFVPYRLTDEMARAKARTEGIVALPLYRVLSGAAVFSVFWGIECALVWQWSASLAVTGFFLVGLVVSGLYARLYVGRVEVWRDRLYALLPLFLNRRAVRRVARAREEVLEQVDTLARRFTEKAEQGLLPPRVRKLRHRIPRKRASALLLAAGLVWFLTGFLDSDVEELALPSQWPSMAGADAKERVEADARSLVAVLGQIDSLDQRMHRLRDEFGSGEKNYYTPEHNDEIRQLLFTYLQLRTALFRQAAFYRNPDEGPPELSSRAFLLSYTAAVELCARGMQFVMTFGGDSNAIRRLNEGSARADVRPGTYDRVRRNLASTETLDELAAATVRFRELRQAGAFPGKEPWPALVAKAETGAGVVRSLSDTLLEYKFQVALDDAVEKGERGRYLVQRVVSTWMGDARIRAREDGKGLLSPAQLEELRGVMKPGDIVLERRNWYLSNAFLPGFWPHATIYFGGRDGLSALGIEEDPRVLPYLSAVGSPDGKGRAAAILESVSEGVILSSLEHSIGGADAVCVLRPLVPEKQKAEAVARAFGHCGKPYDFDFDFFSNDQLVCTELVFSAYEGFLHFELVDIMGRKTLPANEFVRKWERERGGKDAELAFVAFYDMNENEGVAFASGESMLGETLDRPGVTFLQTQPGAPPFPGPGFYLLCAVFVAGLIVLRPRGRIDEPSNATSR